MKHQTCQYCLESTCRLTDVEKRPEIVKEPVRYSIKDVKHPTEQVETVEFPQILIITPFMNFPLW